MSRPPRNPFIGQLPLGHALPSRSNGTPRRPGIITPGSDLPGSPTASPGLLDAVVDWALYRDGLRQPVSGFDAACHEARDGDGFLWLGMHEPAHDQLSQLGAVFSLHPLAVEDAANTRQRPKLERYDDVLFLSLRTLAYVEREDRDEGGDIVETGAVMVFVGEHFVITVRHGRHASMTG